jgi:sensor histidine kinase YesM
MIRKTLYIIISLLLGIDVHAQDSLTLAKGMYKIKTNGLLIQDNNYDYDEAVNQIRLKGSITYKDKGRPFRSFDTYWHAVYLVNNTDEVFHLNSEGYFELVFLDRVRVQHCVYEACKDERNIIQQSQNTMAYFDVPPGVHLLVSKISDFHLNKYFKPIISDSNTFEALTSIEESKSIYFLVFFSSLFFLLSIISLAMFYTLKDKSFLFYSLFSLTLLFHFTRILGESHENFDVVNKYVPWIYLKVPIFLLFYIFYSLFIIYFINAKVKYKDEYKLMKILITIPIVLSVPEVYFLLTNQLVLSYTYYFIVRFLTTLTGVYFLFRIFKYKNDILVKIVIIGGGSLLFCDLYSSFFERAQYQVLFLACLLLDVITFIFGISYKIYLEIKRRINLSAEVQKKEETISILTQATHQLSANFLQAQMNPHFLFNALNSIKYHVINNESEKASYYLTKFANLMRMVLDHSALKSISLKKELEALELYIELESIRFEGEFSYTLHINDEVELDIIQVPPLIIQPFVENVFVHAFKDKIENCILEIEVSEVGDSIIIEIKDNGPGLPEENNIHKSSKALQINKQRLKEWGDLNDLKTSLEISNIYDESKMCKGTKVRIVL